MLAISTAWRCRWGGTRACGRKWRSGVELDRVWHCGSGRGEGTGENKITEKQHEVCVGKVKEL